MVVDGDVPLDDKAKRMRDLLSSFYTPDHSSMPSGANASSQNGTLDAINTTSFDPDQYMNLLVQKSNLDVILQRHVEMAAEIKNLDTDLQMLVYENYNKFISATDTIKRMKSNILGMEANMEQLLDKIMSVQSRSDWVNTSLFEKREQIEKLHRTCNLLRKVQFIYDLPARLGKCIKSEAYGDAVKFYTGAMPIFKAYGDSSFQDCKRASEAAVAIIIKNLQGKLFSDTESIQARAEAAMLLKQLDFPVDSLEAKLLEKLEQSVGELQLKNSEMNNVSAESNDSSKHGNPTELVSMAVYKSSVYEFVEAVRAYRVIFPDSEKQLIGLAQGLVTKHFETVDHYVKNRISSDNLMGLLRSIWTDVLLMEKVLPEALLPDYSVEMAQVAVKQYVVSTLSHLQHDISDALTKVHLKQKEVVEEQPLQASLEASKKAVLQGSMDVLLNCRQLLEDDLGLLVKLRDSIVNWVQEGFHDFFGKLHSHFLMLLGGNNPSSQYHSSIDGTLGDKVLAGLVLVSVQLCAFVEQTAIPRITEEIAVSFSGGDVRSYENGTAFVPGEICRMFHSDSEKFLHQYIHMKTRTISLLLKKRFTTPNWMKHKEPREVHMFVDFFLRELQAIEAEVKQILPQALFHKHRQSGSNGSTTSSRSIPLRENKYPLRQDKLLTRSNTQRARSQLLETHLAKLFKQKVEIFTKVEFTQESVVTAIVKLCLKSLQEFVRLKTFNRSGFQQIQLDVHFVRMPLREIVEDEAAIDLLLDEVIVAASERCLDPIPLEPPILDKLLQAKLGKTKEQSQISA